MKRIVFIFLFYFLTGHSYAQSLYGLYGGAGITTNYAIGSTPLFGAEFLVSPSRHIYIGGCLFSEGYAITRADDEFARFGGYGYTITQNTSYLFVTPTIDVGIGHKEHIHPFFSAGPGFLLSGEQNISLGTVSTLPTGVHPGLSYDPGNTSANLTHTVFRFGMGVAGHITIFDNWELVLAPELALIPSWLSTNSYGYAGDASMNIKSNYICFHAGIMYKRGWSPFSPRRSWGGY